MNGDEHYRMAESYLATAREISGQLAGMGTSVPPELLATMEAGERAILSVCARAQVHATLALASATLTVADNAASIAGRVGGP